MAITGRFDADFSTFNAAVDGATLSLNRFEGNSASVEKQLSKMANALTGARIISDATLMAEAVERIGGVSVLTDKELAKVAATATDAANKLRALGQDVPAGIQKIVDASASANSHFDAMKGMLGTLAGAFGIAFSVQTVVNFGREILADADALVKLHDTTGISIEGLQRFQIAGDDAGNTIQEITGAIARMEDRLAGGDSSAVAALGKLHLNFEQLRSLTPENQFIAISEAIRQIPDPAEQVNIAIDLFGKSGASILPTLKRGFDDLKDSSVGMSESTVRALDDVGDALGRAARTAKGEAAEAFAFLFLGWGQGERDAANLTKQLDEMGAHAAAAVPKMAALVPPKLPEDLKQIEQNLEADARALAKFQDAMTELNSVGSGWVGTLETIDGETVEGIKYYLQAGVAQNTLATAYGLTAAQVKSVAAALRDETETMKIMAEIEKTTFGLAIEHNKQWRAEALETASRVNAAVLAEFDAQQKLNAEYGRTVDGSMKMSGAAETYRIALEKLHATKVEGISQAQQEQVLIDQYTKALYDEAVAQDQMVNSLQQMPSAAAAASSGVREFTNTLVLGISDLETLNRELTKFYDTYAGQNSVGIPGGGNSAGIPAGGNSAGMPRMAQTGQSSSIWFTTPANAGRASGGPVMAGESYLVGEQGPELYTPAANGFITPNGAGGTTNVTIYVNGTAEDVARKVAAEILRTVSAGQKLRLNG